MRVTGETPDANMQSPTYYEPHWFTGKLKERCDSCDKVVYSNEAQARDVASRIQERVPHMQVYKGRCGHWHVTRGKK